LPYCRGLTYHAQKEYQKAVEDCSRAIELEPGNAEYYYSRSVTYNWMDERELERRDIEKAAELGHEQARSDETS